MPIYKQKYELEETKERKIKILLIYTADTYEFIHTLLFELFCSINEIRDMLQAVQKKQMTEK